MPTKKPPEFGPTQRLQRMYEAGIRKITGRVILKKQPEETFATWYAKLVQRANAPDVQAAAFLLAKQMVHSVSKSNYRTWREAAAKTSKSQLLYQYLQAEMAGATGSRVHQIVRENANLISSLPLEAARTMTDEVMKAQQSGALPKTLAKMASKRFPELLRSRVHLISRTETAKASSALTQARCERLNLDWFEWETSHDKRTRTSHKNMNAVLCSWSDLPSPEKLVGEKDYGKYAAGGTFNCRCLVIPLLSFSDVSWPHRVYWRGAIRQMNLQEFKRIAGGGVEERDAA